MILLFGGTTEGRIAAAELEEAGQTYYYSTKTGQQDVNLHNGIHISGAMDAAAIRGFCREHDIRLVVDAAHPFAATLHQTVVDAAAELALPAIRYERVFPTTDVPIHWVDGYDELPHAITMPHQTLLALTGVQSISRLKPLERMGHTVYYRILNRADSLQLAMGQDADDSRLCFYESDDVFPNLLQRLHPDAIILKESGASGGFVQKAEAAHSMGITVYALRRPSLPIGEGECGMYYVVNGPNGLRLMVQRLLPEFYPLHSGLTTGTCATAAAVAHAMQVCRGVQPESVPVLLPNGETIQVDVQYGDGYAYVLKPNSDDPDVTQGVEVRASVTRGDKPDGEPSGTVAAEEGTVATEGLVVIEGGRGVGRFTLPGFDFPPGEAAINRTPREMIRTNLRPFGVPLRVVVSVPEGEEIARRTFNPRLGIEGGISIIGVSGIVKPYSKQSFLDSIRKCMEVAVASGTERVVINSGAKSEQYLRSYYAELPQQAFVQYGNYIGDTVGYARQLGVRHLTLGIMLGKAVKLAAGELDTHSRRTVMDRDFVCRLLAEAGADAAVIHAAEGITLARELWTLLPQALLPQFAAVVIQHCRTHVAPLLPDGTITVLLVDEEGSVWQ